MARTKFLKVRCEKCNNEQIMFERPSVTVPCLVCKETLAETTGGKAKMTTTSRVLEILD